MRIANYLDPLRVAILPLPCLEWICSTQGLVENGEANHRQAGFEIDPAYFHAGLMGNGPVNAIDEMTRRGRPLPMVEAYVSAMLAAAAPDSIFLSSSPWMISCSRFLEKIKSAKSR